MKARRVGSRSRARARDAKYAPENPEAQRVRDGAWRELGKYCESGWTGDRCTYRLGHPGPRDPDRADVHVHDYGAAKIPCSRPECATPDRADPIGTPPERDASALPSAPTRHDGGVPATPDRADLTPDGYDQRSWSAGWHAALDATSDRADLPCTCRPLFAGHVTDHPDCPRGRAERLDHGKPLDPDATPDRADSNETESEARFSWGDR